MYRPHGRGAIVCSYLTFTDPTLKRAFRLPLVHIRLCHKDKSFRTDALVDSGATVTFIPLELMNVLGFDLAPEGVDPPNQTTEEEKPKAKHQAVGAGGLFSTYEVKIDSIQMIKGSFAFAEFKDWSVLVPSRIGSIPHAVLGRDSVFKKFDVTYRENKEEMVFRRPKQDGTPWGRARPTRN